MLVFFELCEEGHRAVCLDGGRKKRLGLPRARVVALVEVVKMVAAEVGHEGALMLLQYEFGDKLANALNVE